MHGLRHAHAISLDRAGERAAASASFLDATCAGVGGLIDDFLTYATGWGFAPEVSPVTTASLTFSVPASGFTAA